MAKFQCNSTKTLVEVFTEYDINGMRLNPSYTEVIEEQEVVKVVPPVKRSNNKSTKEE